MPTVDGKKGKERWETLKDGTSPQPAQERLI